MIAIPLGETVLDPQKLFNTYQCEAKQILADEKTEKVLNPLKVSKKYFNKLFA